MATNEFAPQNLKKLKNIIPMTKWEDDWEHADALRFQDEHWYLPFALALFFYLPVLYVGQKIMKNREPMNVRLPMLFWNSALAIFSIIGFLKVIPEFVHAINKGSLYHSYCNNSLIHVKPAVLWNFLFILSKIPELGDTFFLVLRKQKLIFLHVYHHASVLIFSWFVYNESSSQSRWYSTMNLAIHSIMYTYYALKALPNIIKIPKWVSMLITTMQTIQMVIGALIGLASYYAKLSGQECQASYTITFAGIFIYVSYLFLFSKFFYESYCLPRPPREGKNVLVADKKRV